MAIDICDYLRGNKYPGRGVLLGRCPDGERFALYFIMGRSENSRNRVFAETEDGIRTLAADPAKLADPSLIIYHPVRRLGDRLIVTNGDQTDTIRDRLQSGGDFRDALRSREFEPDPPLYTPRVSGLIHPDGGYELSILKSADGDPSLCERYFFEYAEPLRGLGHIIHTYQNDGNPPPSFAGEPVAVRTGDDAEAFASRVWDALDADNRVALWAVRGAENPVIINRFARV
ncbi:MAG: IMP cyclohydrolase [Oscillospiraceae bacterium]|jgi:IMP cyclohydrolase|nr:IMP cyclohydrolase [Oscillospiraceae bacterium]